MKKDALTKTQLRALDYLVDQGGEALDGCKMLSRPTASALYGKTCIEPVSAPPAALWRRWHITEHGREERVRAHKAAGRTT